MYSHSKCCVKDDYTRSEFFDYDKGVWQGCILSPLLFNLYLNELCIVQFDLWPCPSGTHPQGFAILFFLGGLFPTPGHAERDNSPTPSSWSTSFTFFGTSCCGIFYCVWNISASAGSINNQDCIFHFFRFISFVHSYITIVLNVLLKITMLTSFMVTTSKRLNYVCPAANRTWQRLTIISCDLTHERDTYFLNISHIIYLNYYLPRINRLQSKPLRLIKTNRVNSIIRHRIWLYA